jgi:SAM-dependent methyltransferase
MGADPSPFSVNWLVLRINRKYVAEAAGRYARGRLLDVGCGERPYAAELGAHAEVCVGLEFDQKRYAGMRPEVWGSGLALPFGDGSFDTVFSSQVLEHVPEPAQMVAEIGRVLGPGGHLILSAPHIWGVHEEPDDYFRFTGYGLAHLARRAGLEPLCARPMAGYWVTAGARFCHYLQQFEKVGLALVTRPLYALVQLTALFLDRLHRVESDAWNFLLVARKPELVEEGRVAE